MKLMPDFYFNRVTDIPPAFLKQHGIEGLILDIDNTLTFDNENSLPDEVALWLRSVAEADIAAVVVSNNKSARGKAFSALCGLPFVSDALKPSQRTLPLVLEMLRTDVARIAVIGDQIYTDIWYGKRAGCKTILVEKMGDDIPWFVKTKRVLETPIIKQIRKRGVTKL